MPPFSPTAAHSGLIASPDARITAGPRLEEACSEFAEAQLVTTAAALFARDVPASDLLNRIIGDLVTLGKTDVTELAERLGTDPSKSEICRAIDRMGRVARRRLLAHMRELRQFTAYMSRGAICDALNVTVPAMSQDTFSEFVAVTDATLPEYA